MSNVQTAQIMRRKNSNPSRYNDFTVILGERTFTPQWLFSDAMDLLEGDTGKEWNHVSTSDKRVGGVLYTYYNLVPC